MTQLHARRLAAQRLSGPPASTVDEVVGGLLAVQAQDPRGARLAVRARSEGLHASDVDRALNERQVLITWVNRGTLHLVRAEDHGWLRMVTTPQLATGNARRLEQEGVSPEQAERGVLFVERALLDGPQTRRQLRESLRARDIPVDGQAFVHLMLLASLRGICVRGPMARAEQAWVLLRDWLPSEKALEQDAALGELARRYLIGHGPASDRDLARWAGVSLGQARTGFKQLRLVEVDGLADLPDRPEPPPLPPPKLLGAFEPLLLGWESREPVCGPHQGIVTMNGIFRPIALVKGKAVATWTLPRHKVELLPFGPLSGAVTKHLTRDAAAVEAFLAR